MSAYHVIGDQDTVLGYRFAGVSGDVVEDAAQAQAAFEKALNDPSVTVLLPFTGLSETPFTVVEEDGKFSTQQALGTTRAILSWSLLTS